MKNILFALSATLIMLFVSNNAVTAQTTDKCCENCKGAGNDCCKDNSCCKSAGMTTNCKDMNCGKDKGCCKNESGSMTTDPKKDAVTGEAIPEGKAVEFAYLGKTYYFLNADNLAKFKSEPIDYDKDITCPVMGEGASKEYFSEYNGTKYYVCCPPCLKKISNNPEKYLKLEKKDEHKGHEGHDHK